MSVKNYEYELKRLQTKYNIYYKAIQNAIPNMPKEVISLCEYKITLDYGSDGTSTELLSRALDFLVYLKEKINETQIKLNEALVAEVNNG